MNHGSSERTPAFLPLLAINRRAATSLVKNVTNSNVTIYIVTFSIYFSYFFVFFYEKLKLNQKNDEKEHII